MCLWVKKKKTRRLDIVDLERIVASVCNIGRIVLKRFLFIKRTCIQLIRERLSENSTKVHATRRKGNMGRSRELLHVLSTNKMAT